MMFHKYIVFFALSFFTAIGVAATSFDKYEFTNHENKKVKFTELKDSYVFVSFLFTRCPSPTMCPLTMRLTQQTQELWKKSIKNPAIKVWVVTIDPEHDSPAILKGYAASKKADLSNMTLVTGGAQMLNDFASEFNVVGLPSATALISHNMKSILLAPGFKEISQFKDNEWKAQDVINKAQDFLKSQATQKTSSTPG